ncbi:MAG TPA: helix-turn-helix domain-containing protein [Ktedonobacterales bacterium]|nr:helix-turn-helix domain-containing protein [Ktedonobacterales bacterium]
MARPADPQRREAILRAAREVFLERGYSEARLSDIAQRAGIVPSTLYLYFESKEEMVRAIAGSMRQETVQEVLPILEHLRDRNDIIRLVQTLLSAIARNPDIFRLIQLDTGLRSVRFHPSRPAHGPVFQDVIRVLETQMDQGFIRRYDAMALIDTLVGLLRWMVELYALLEADQQAQYQETFVDMLSAMLLP